MPVLPKISPDLIQKYQEEISKNSSSATAKRKSASLNKFFGWAEQEGHIDANPMLATPRKNVGLRTLAILGTTFGIIILIFLLTWKLKFPIQFINNMAANLGGKTITQVVPTPTPASAISANITGNTQWNLYASLKLTDSAGSPQVGSQTITFNVYNSETGGTALYTSDPQTVTTDSNGSALISLDQVPSDLFFQNRELFLEPVVGSEAASARIPISTANIAANLGGYFPANPDTGATELTIPVIDNSGSLNLASASPAINASAGKLLVQGQAVIIKSVDGGNGNITINPDGSGIANFLFEGSRGNFLSASAPNLNSGSLYYGVVANNTTGYYLLKLQSGSHPITRFSVDALGNASSSGNINAGGDLQTSGVSRVTSAGALKNITGYSQNSGNFTINQNPGDFASIIKTGTALSDVLNLTLNENGITGSHYASLVLSRLGGDDNARALLVKNGNAEFDGQIKLGNFVTNPGNIGTGSLVYNTTDNKVYVWNGTVWQAVGAGGSGSSAFDAITSGTNTSATMIVDTGASLDYANSGTINASFLEGGTWEAPGAIGSTTPNTGAFATTASPIAVNIDNTQTTSSDIYGIYANANLTDGSYTGTAYGGYFNANSTSASLTYGVYGNATATDPDSIIYGVFGVANDETFGVGVGGYGGYWGGYFYSPNTGSYTEANGGDNTLGAQINSYGYVSGTGISLVSNKAGPAASSTYGIYNATSNYGHVDSGLDETYGSYINVIRDMAIGGTINTYGERINLSSLDNAGAGTHTAYGLYLDNVTGADTNYSIYSAGGQSYFADNLALGAGTYLNFGSTYGTNGYGFRDDSGNIEFKNSGGSWTALGAGSGSTAWSSLTNPTDNLNLAMGTHTTTFNWATGTSTNNLFNLTTDASANGTGSLLNIQTGVSSTLLPLRVRAGSTEALAVDATGNVGIGTTVPSARLDINGAVIYSDTELITNGTFDYGTDGWTLGDNVTYGSQNVVSTYDGGEGDPSLSTTFSTTAGHAYLLTFTISDANAPMEFYLDNIYFPYNSGPFSNGTQTVYIPTDYTGTETITFTDYNYDSGDTWTLDNVSIKESSSILPALKVTGWDGSTALSLGGDILGNTALGLESFASNTTGQQNTAFGEGALHSNTEGNYNSVLGYDALNSNTTGEGNVAIGDKALQLNTTGMSNTAIGNAALLSNISGQSNVAIGESALSANTYGIYNTALGEAALASNTEGDSNTALGSWALPNNTTGTNNVAIGNYAGLMNDTGSGNLFLGQWAGAYETGSNKLYIGNYFDQALIYGDFSLGYVGIGTTSPTQSLSVFGGNVDVADAGTLGDESLTNPNLTGGTSWTATNDCSLTSDAATCTFSAGTPSTIQQASGSLAVAGVGSRWYRFDYTVSGASTAPTAYISTSFASATTALTLTNGTHTTYFQSTASPTNFVITTTMAVDDAFTIDSLSLKEVQGGNLALAGVLTGGGTTGLKVLANGNVGIGDLTPDHTLDVAGNIGLDAGSYINWGDTDGTTGYGFRDDGGNIEFKNSGGSWTALGAGSGSTAWSSLTDPTDNLTLNMGAYTSTWTWNATTGSNNLFNLTDTASNTGTGYLLNLTTATDSTLKPFHVSAAGNEAITVLANGNVGIGDTTPDHKLDVDGNIGLTEEGYINWGDTDGTDGYGLKDNSGTIQWKNSGGDWTNIGGGGGSSVWSALTNPTDDLSLAMGAYTTTWAWDSLTTETGLTASSTSLSSGSLASLSVNSTAAASNTQKVLSLSTAGDNSTDTQTTYGLYATNTHTGTDSTNVGGYFSASGGTNNYGLIVENGNVGIGTTSPLSPLQVIGSILGDNLVLAGNNQLSGVYGFSNYLNSSGGLGAGGLQYLTAAGNLINLGSIQAGQLNITSGGTFGAGTTYYLAGVHPGFVTSADFNGDGKADLVSTDANGDELTVFLNNGDGTFGAGTTYPSVGNSPGGVTSTDFNGDGKTDLASANYDSNNLTVFLNNGNGTFGAGTTYPTLGTHPESVTSADFNGDGKADLASANWGNATLTVFLNNGDGTFGAGTTYPTLGTYPKSVTSADFNGDGKADLATADYGGSNLTVFLNNGDGTFGAGTTYPTIGVAPQSVTSADFNGDGKADLASANHYGNNLTVFLNNGDGTFGAGTTYPSVGVTPESVTSADFNGDGKADLASANFDSNNLTVFLNNGDGTFGAGTTYPSVGSGPQSVTSADFNGDGKADLATANYYGNNLAVFINNSSTTLFTSTAGNVGIGTTGPTGKLNVVSTTEQLRLGYDASNYWSSTVDATGGLTLAGTGDLAVNTNQLYVDTSTGNVGIGTISPGAKLEIAGDLYFSNGADRVIGFPVNSSNTAHKLSIIGNDASCFAAGTQITLGDGSKKNIETVQIGDTVKTYDTEKKEFTHALVTKTFYHTPEQMGDYYLILKTDNNHEVKITPNHPVYVNQSSWQEAGTIQVGDSVVGDQGSREKVIEVTKVYEKISTYNIEVETYHDYFVGFLVHNKVATNGGDIYMYGGLGNGGPGNVIMANTGSAQRGNVGIGNILPVGKLDISGAVVGKALVILNETGDQAIFTASSSGTTKFVIDHSGNVGIGTTSPTGQLNVVSTTEQLRLGYDASNYWSSTVDATGGLTLAGTGTGGSLTLTPTAGQNLNISLSGTGDLAVNTNQLYVDTSTGNVGIGTAEPGAELHVKGSAIFSTYTGLTGDDGKLQFIDNVNDGYYRYFDGDEWKSLAGGTVNVGDIWSGPSAEGLIWYNGGNVGIGTTDPAIALEVVGEIRGTKFAFQDDTDTYLDTLAADKLALATGGTERLTIDSSGNVGIGTTNPGAKLEINGTATYGDTELVTNGTFDDGTDGWILGDNVTYGSQNVVSTYDGGEGDPSLSTTFSTTAGHAYLLTFTISDANAPMRFYLENDYPPYYNSGPFSNGTQTVYFPTDYTGTETITFDDYNYDSGDTWTLDSVSIKEVSSILPALKVTGYDGSTALSLGGDVLGNTALGLESFASNTSGTNNSAFGEGALHSNSSGSNNIALGYYALASSTSQSDNVAIGNNALQLSNAGGNVAVGNWALASNTEGPTNTAVGLDALTSNTYGGNNVALGYYALGGNTEGNFNTVLGANALSGGTGSNNVALGYGAGQNNGGSGNVFIGYEAGQLESGSDNKLYIANNQNTTLIYGDFSLGYVGIGTTSPTQSLSVFGGNVDVADAGTLGDESLTNGTLDSGSSWSQTEDCILDSDAATCAYSNGGESTIEQASGDLNTLGVGNRWYEFVYTVSGTANAPTASITTSFASTDTALTISDGTHTTYFQSADPPSDFIISTTLTSGQAFTLDDLSLEEVQGGNLALAGILTGGGTTGLKVLANGNVGIGTVTPTSALDVAGTVTIGAQADSEETGSDTVTTNPAAGTFGAETARDKVASSVVYKGKLFVSTAETNLAGVYRYDGGTTWTLVTSATLGKAVSDDSAADADAFVMTVFNGALWIGSQTGSATGALYYSTTADTASTGDNFTLVNSARGTSGMSQTGINGYTDLVVFNGNLYVATQTANLLEIGRYDGGTGAGAVFTQINATDGKLAAESAVNKDGAFFAVYDGRLFIGTITGSTTATVGVYSGVGTTITALNATPGTFGAISSMIDVTSMKVWNGQLYVAVSKTSGGGGIFRWLPAGVIGVDTTVTNFNLVNYAEGQLVSEDTAADQDSYVLQTYNGHLYAGSQDTGSGNHGAFYEYNDTYKNWTRMTAADLGTFGAETDIDSVSTMQEYNGTLYIGTNETDSGSVYTWTKTTQNSYALRFDSGSTNYGAISFVGNTQAEGQSGHYGTFNFSNAISLETGAFDYAEDYPTMDQSLDAGDLVSADPQNPENVKIALPGEQVLGIVSANPGMRLSSSAQPSNGAVWVPIALAGRVSVKVSTENGPISVGDPLTSSSLPGVAMKATKAGNIVGTALGAYSSTDPNSISTIIVYINQTWYNPTQITDLSGLSIDKNPDTEDYRLTQTQDGNTVVVDTIADFANVVAANIKAGAIVTSDLATNSFMAFQGTIDHLLITSGLVSANIQTALISPIPGGTDVTVKIGTEATPSGKFAIQNSSGGEVASIDNQGNATFSGTVHSQNIDEIQKLLNQVSTDQSVLLAATASANLNATGSATIAELITNDLYVTGQAAINSLSVTTSITLGSDLVIGQDGNTINSLSAPLQIQSLAMAPIQIMAGLVTIDTHGNVQIAGDLVVAGKITTPDLEAGVINTPEFVIAAPDATQAGTIVNGVITTNSTIGKAVIPAGTSEITIQNPKVTDYTLVYVTPTSSTQNNVLYVKSKQAGQFIVGFSDAINVDANFNWWIVQVTQ